MQLAFQSKSLGDLVLMNFLSQFDLMLFQLRTHLQVIRIHGQILAIIALTLFYFENGIAVEIDGPNQNYQNSVSEIVAFQNFEANDIVDDKHLTRFYNHNHRTKNAVLILHGLYESPHYIKSIAEHIFNLGNNVLSLRLKHHWEMTDHEMTRTNYNNWIGQVRWAANQMKGLGEKTVVLGFSTGGLLAAYLGLSDERAIHSLILFDPALSLSASSSIGIHLGQMLKLNPANYCRDNFRTLVCRFGNWVDPSFFSSVKEGLALAPVAGFELISMSHLIFREFKERVRYLENYGMQKVFDAKSAASHGLRELDMSQVMMQIYALIKPPTLVFLSNQSGVVDNEFTRKSMRLWKNKNKLVEFQNKMFHTNITKSAREAFVSSPEHFNEEFEKVLDEITLWLAGQ
jgi:pimeloyl-ACP methyl ester carboxylesterase